MKHADNHIQGLYEQFSLLQTEHDRLKELNKDLTEAMEKAQHDINWMLNNRQFLNQDCFNYLEAILAKAKYEIRRFEM